jgi:hypothetical protein
MADAPTTAIRDAFVAEVLADPFRPRAQVVAAVVTRTGLAAAEVDAALVLPGSLEWVAEFSPTRLLPEVSGVRTVEQLEDDIASDDAKVRRAAVHNLVRHVNMSDATREIVLAAMSHEDAGTRLAAIPGSWRHRNTGDRDAILVRVRELATDDPDLAVRAAAIRRLGADADRDPRTVTALLATAADGATVIKTAAIHALRHCGRGYRRVLPVIARGLLSDDAPLRRTAWKTVCELAADQDADSLARWLIESVTRNSSITAEQASNLRELRERVPALIPALEQRLRSASEMDRAAAPRLLSYLVIGDEADTVARILDLRGDYSPFVRASADWSIAALRIRFSEAASSSADVREMLS